MDNDEEMGKCPLCNEPCGDITSIRYHLIKDHGMDFDDDESMIRRLGNIGITITIPEGKYNKSAFITKVCTPVRKPPN